MLTHTPSAVAVFQTSEYNSFTFIKGNRPLNMKKIDKIIKEIESGNNMLKYYPVLTMVTDSKLQILDGQHRFFICRKLQQPVHYVLVSDEKTMVEIARINSNAEKWATANFISCYKLAGYQDYEVIEWVMHEYGFSLGITLSLLTTGDPGSINGSTPKLHNDFQEGKFKVATKHEAIEFGKVCKLFSGFANWRSRNFVVAIHRIVQAGKIDIKDLAAAWLKNPGMLTPQATFKDYIIALEKIINVGKHNRIIIT